MRRLSRRQVFGLGAGALTAGASSGSKPTREGPARNGPLVMRGPGYGFLDHGVQQNPEAIKNPHAIVVCRSATDVRAALRFAEHQGLAVGVRGGGQSPAGCSATNGLLLDMSPLRGFSIDRRRRTVTVGAGTLVGDFIKRLQTADALVAAPNVPSLGVGGTTLCGGFGPFSRAYGLLSDRLVSTDLVTVDGSVVRASESSHPDLFWALRGGGGSNLGVNTTFTYRLSAVPRRAGTAYGLWDLGDPQDLLSFLQERLLGAPNSVGGRITITKSAPRGGASTGTLSVLLRLTSMAGTQPLHRIVNEAFARWKPLISYVRPMSFAETERDTLVQPWPLVVNHVSTRYIESAVSADGLATMITWAKSYPGSSSPWRGRSELYLLGGAINEIAPRATAYPHRSAKQLWILFATYALNENTTQVAKDVRTWQRGYVEAMAPYVLPAAYQGLTDPTLATWAQYYYGANLARLSAVKRAWNPRNVLAYPQAVPLSHLSAAR